jgi:hypothetical protein
MKKNSNTLAQLFQQRNILVMNLKKRLLSISNVIILAFLLATASNLQAQVGIASTSITADPSAMLEVRSTAKGFLAPRMTKLQKDAIVSKANGLIVFQTDSTSAITPKGYYFYDSVKAIWKRMLTDTVPIVAGGTGASTKSAAFDSLSPMNASGDIIYGGNNGKGTRLIKGSDGQFLALSSGLPAWQTKLPIANGGTNAITKSAAFDSLSPMTTRGDIIIFGGSPAVGTRLAKGDSGKVLTMGTNEPSWQTPASSSGSGSLIKVTYLTSTTQLTNQSLDANTTAILVKMVGGGGAGAGVNAYQSAAGGGGGAGGYLEKYITGISSSTKYSFNCGAGGTGVSAADGNNGDSTQFTILSVSYKAGGGKGGKYLAASDKSKTSAMGGAGGTSVNGNINAGGAPGGWTWVRDGEQASSGAGGSSPFGGGGIGIAYTDNVAGSSVGYAANGNGAGGGGACNGATATARAGGNGSPGLIIIYEYR